MPTQPGPQPPIRRLLRVRNGALAGFGVSLLGIGIGLGRALLIRLTGNRVSFDGFLPVMVWYAGGFALGGGLVGLFWPAGSSAARRRLVIIAGMSVVVGAIAIMESGSPLTWHVFDWVLWAGSSVLFGLAFSIGYERT